MACFSSCVAQREIRSEYQACPNEAIGSVHGRQTKVPLGTLQSVVTNVTSALTKEQSVNGGKREVKDHVNPKSPS